MDDTEIEGLSDDEIFYILSNQRRRYVLYYLKQHSGPVELMEVVDQMAAWEEGVSVDAVPEQAQKRAYVALYQTHIPKLEEAGLVEYDSDSGILSLSDTSRDLDRYIGTNGESDDAREEPRWYLFYIGLVVANSALLGAVVSGVLPLDLSVANGITILSILVLAVFHLSYMRYSQEA
jgi:DNA-binding transcriptional ArsR family regulator